MILLRTLRQRLPPLGALGRGAMITSVGLWLRAVLQAVYLILVSRWLGAAGYGLFAGSMAAVVLFAPLAGMGMGYVFTDHLARTPDLAGGLWRRVVAVGGGCAVAVAAVVAIGVAWAMPQRLGNTTLVALAASELIAVPTVSIASTALLAVGRVGLANLVVVLIPLVRIALVAGVMLAHAAPSLAILVAAHMLGAFLVMPCALRVATHQFTKSSAGAVLPTRMAMVGDGIAYALGGAISAGYPEVDKVLILRILGPGETGVYTAAFRVISVLTMPVVALVTAALPRLFMTSLEGGKREKMLRRVALAGVAYGLVGALLALALAPTIPWIFGADFAAASHYVLLLAAWVPLAAAHQIGATALLTVYSKPARILMEGLGLLSIAALDILLLPRMGLVGAVYGLLAGEVVMTACCWWFFRRRAQALQTR